MVIPGGNMSRSIDLGSSLRGLSHQLNGTILDLISQSLFLLRRQGGTTCQRRRDLKPTSEEWMLVFGFLDQIVVIGSRHLDNRTGSTCSSRSRRRRRDGGRIRGAELLHFNHDWTFRVVMDLSARVRWESRRCQGVVRFRGGSGRRKKQGRW